MSGGLASLALATIIGWIGFALLGLVVATPLSVYAGAAIGVISVLLFRDTLVLGGMVALLAPFGVLLPALALRHMGGTLGMPIPGFGTAELLVFLIAYVVFLATAMGVIPVDLYRLGYAPVPVAAMVLVLCAYGALTGNWFVPLVAVLGQLGWVMGWGSSNWFDYVLHALLVPVTVVVLLTRLV